MAWDSIQKRVLAAAQRLCDEAWTFRPVDVVRALPGENPRTVRTEVTSRCCVDAPEHHARRWPYFRRVGRGRYRIEPQFRQRPPAPVIARDGGTGRPAPAAQVAETAPAYGHALPDARDAIHGVVIESEGWYVAECLEIAVVTQARSLDALMVGLREAVALHLEGEDPARLGLSRSPRLLISYEAPPVGA